LGLPSIAARAFGAISFFAGFDAAARLAAMAAKAAIDYTLPAEMTMPAIMQPPSFTPPATYNLPLNPKEFVPELAPYLQYVYNRIALETMIDIEGVKPPDVVITPSVFGYRMSWDIDTTANPAPPGRPDLTTGYANNFGPLAEIGKPDFDDGGFGTGTPSGSGGVGAPGAGPGTPGSSPGSEGSGSPM
jgi:hypothetical protein